MSLARDLLSQINSINEGYGKDNKYRNLVDGPKGENGNIVTRSEVQRNPDRYFKKNEDGYEELREYLTDIAEEALKRNKQGGSNPYGQALKLVQRTDNKTLAQIDGRIRVLAKNEGGLPSITDMDNATIKKILKG